MSLEDMDEQVLSEDDDDGSEGESRLEDEEEEIDDEYMKNLRPPAG